MYCARAQSKCLKPCLPCKEFSASLVEQFWFSQQCRAGTIMPVLIAADGRGLAPASQSEETIPFPDQNPYQIRRAGNCRLVLGTTFPLPLP